MDNYSGDTSYSELYNDISELFVRTKNELDVLTALHRAKFLTSYNLMLTCWRQAVKMEGDLVSKEGDHACD